MKALGEEDHDVGVVFDLVADVAVGHLAESQRRHALPHLEGLPDGFVSLVLTHLGGVILYAGEKRVLELPVMGISGEHQQIWGPFLQYINKAIEVASPH